MKKKILLLVLMFALVLTSALIGCSKKTTTDPVTDPDKQPEQVESTEPKTVIFARGGDSVSLDPASVTDGESSRVTKQMLETLVEFAQDSFAPGPGLATSWDILDDGYRYVFHLREGVKFHDGTDFDAQAVIFNFERWADKEHPHHYAAEGFAYSSYGNQFGGFKGEPGHKIKEINEIDKHTVEFVLTEPLAAFIQNMGMTYFAIQSPTAFEVHGARIIENPVGTGPFMFKEWRRNETITVVKNPNYWMAGYPKVDTVIFQVIPDNSARLTALRAGQIDIMDGLNPDDMAVIEGDAKLTLFERASNNVGYLGFNVKKAPFDNNAVRIAMNHAVNKEALISALYNNLAVTAKNPLPPSYLGYNDKIEEYTYNPELAKQMLADAGFPNGFEFDLWTMPVARPYMPDPQKAAEALQADFAQVGLKANIVTMEWATYLELTQKGDQDVYMLGWSGVNGDPDYFVYNLLSKHSIPGANRSFYANDEVSDLLVQAQSIADLGERAAMYENILEMIHADAPWIPLVHNTPVVAGTVDITNYVPHPSTSEVLTYIDIKN